MGYLIAVLIGYLMGSSNMAFYIARMKHADLRGGGSGNLGASNAVALLGWRVGAVVAAHDILKSVAAVLMSCWLFPQLPNVGAVAGVACVLGHIFPFYLKFRGGKGFAAYIGMTIALNWKLALVIMAVVVLVTVVTDYIVLGTMTTVVAVPVVEGILTRSLMLPLILLIATAVIVYKHRENFPRILNGTELGLRSAIRGENKVKK